MSVIDEIKGESNLEEELARVRRFIEDSRVEDARRLATEMAARWPDDSVVQQLARVLAPPAVLAASAPADRPHRSEREWLKKHAHEHPGCWIALHEDRLIAARPRLSEVLALVRETIGDKDSVLFYQPEPGA